MMDTDWHVTCDLYVLLPILPVQYYDVYNGSRQMIELLRWSKYCPLIWSYPTYLIPQINNGWWTWVSSFRNKHHTTPWKWKTPCHNPQFTFPHCLASSFALLDPITAADTSDATTFCSHGGAARALFCVGPSPLWKDTLDCLPCLECVITHCVGIDHIDLSECRRRGINVANVGDSLSDDVADCPVGFALDVLRKISAAHRFVRAGSWPQTPGFPLGSRVSGLALAWNS